MKSIPRDTTREAMLKQDEILRRIGPCGRAAMTFELNDGMRSLVEAGVRDRHPDWDSEAVRRKVLRLLVGEELFQQVYPPGAST